MSIFKRKKKEKRLYIVKIFFYDSDEVYTQRDVEESELDGIFLKALTSGVKLFTKSGKTLIYFPPKRVDQMQVRLKK